MVNDGPSIDAEEEPARAVRCAVICNLDREPAVRRHPNPRILRPIDRWHSGSTRAEIVRLDVPMHVARVVCDVDLDAIAVGGLVNPRLAPVRGPERSGLRLHVGIDLPSRPHVVVPRKRGAQVELSVTEANLLAAEVWIRLL